MNTYREKPPQVQAERFFVAVLPWPPFVHGMRAARPGQRGARLEPVQGREIPSWYAVLYGDLVLSIRDGEWIVYNRSGQRPQVMNDATFNLLYELVP